MNKVAYIGLWTKSGEKVCELDYKEKEVGERLAKEHDLICGVLKRDQRLETVGVEIEVKRLCGEAKDGGFWMKKLEYFVVIQRGKEFGGYVQTRILRHRVKGVLRYNIDGVSMGPTDAAKEINKRWGTKVLLQILGSES